jgi:EAL domain-containing protein (putative c-di-GMP-specific phosphodiesterase class I)
MQSNHAGLRPIKAPLATILVVDDDQIIRRLLARVLSAKGYHIVVAEDGRDAQALLAKQDFDLILSDVRMPRMNGVEVLRLVREHDPDLPVILFTGSPSVETAIDALQLRATAYLTKPLEPVRLIEEIEKALKLQELARLRRQASELNRRDSERAIAMSDLASRFQSALDGVFVAFQPIVRWSTRAVHGYEALVRCTEASLSHPLALFDAAEKLEQWEPLGQAIRSSAAAPFDQLDRDAHLFVNLHARDLLDETLYDRAHKLSRVSRRVVLEITERAHLDSVPDAERRVARLRSMGFKIAIDDIGAGYSGLNSFAMLRPDFVKLDMALVRDIDKDPVKQRLTALLVELCLDLGIGVIGEGVETARERDTLVALGCDLLQGFYFGRPSPPFVVPNF